MEATSAEILEMLVAIASILPTESIDCGTNYPHHCREGLLLARYVCSDQRLRKASSKVAKIKAGHGHELLKCRKLQNQRLYDWELGGTKASTYTSHSMAHIP